MDDLQFRLAHYLWRGGAQLMNHQLTKKQVAHALHAVLPGEENERKLVELGVKGDVAAVAKARSKEELGEALQHWAKRLSCSEIEDLLRRTRIVVSVMAPLDLPPQAAAAANDETAAMGKQHAFEVKLRVSVRYRELRDVDMQLANPLAPNHQAADDGMWQHMPASLGLDWFRLDPPRA